MRPAGFKHYIQRKSRQQSSVDPPPLNIEPVPVPPSFQHPHSYLPPNAYAALAAGAANLKYALSGPVWDHSLSRQFSQECLAQFEPPAIAQRPKSPSPPASTRSSQISPKMKRPVVSSRRKENAVQRKDSHVDAGSNLSRDSVKKASLKHINDYQSSDRRRYSNATPYSSDISYSKDSASSQFECAIQDSDSEYADDETSETSETSEGSDVSVASVQLRLEQRRQLRSELRRYEFGGPTTAGKYLFSRKRRESAPSPEVMFKRRRLN